MHPEKITVSLEMAKKLKEAGWVNGNSIFEYTNGVIDLRSKELSDEILDAPTAEEILRRLPEVLYLGEEREAVYLSIMPDDYKWIVLYSPNYDQRCCDKENFWKRSKNNLADACAIMYCFLSERNLLSPPHDS